MKQIDMDKIIEHGYPSEDGQLCRQGVQWLFGKRQEKQCRSDGHEDIQQGRGVLGDVEKRHNSEEGVMLNGPGSWVSVEVGGAQQDKYTDSRPTQDRQGLLTSGRVLVRGIELTQIITETDKADPGQDGITHCKHIGREGKEMLFMEEGPGYGAAAVAGYVDTVQ